MLTLKFYVLLIIVACQSVCYSNDGKDVDGLFQAIKASDTKLVEQYINEGVDVNTAHKRYTAPIFIAVVCDKYEIAQMLVRKGANVNISDEFTWTPLHSVVREGSARMAKLLISAGAVIDARTKEGDTPLNLISSKTSADVVAVLLASGADCNSRGTMNITPLHVSALENNEKVVEVLLKSGASVNAICDGGVTVLMAAVMHYGASLKLVELLLKAGANVDQADVLGNLPIHHAINASNMAVSSAIIDTMKNVNVKNKAGSTPLLVAVAREELGIAKKLMARGAFLELKTAAALGNIDAVKSALRKGADINSIDEFDNTALDYAIRYHRKHVVSFLKSLNAHSN